MESNIWDTVDQFVERVDAVSNSDVDQWFAQLRDFLAHMGISDITPSEARITLAIIGFYQSVSEDTQLLLNGYLGTIAGRDKGGEQWRQEQSRRKVERTRIAGISDPEL